MGWDGGWGDEVRSVHILHMKNLGLNNLPQVTLQMSLEDRSRSQTSWNLFPDGCYDLVNLLSLRCHGLSLITNQQKAEREFQCLKGYNISSFIFTCFIFPSVCPQCFLFVCLFFQIVMDEGQKVGSSFQGDLNRAGKVKVRHDSILFHGQNPERA